MSDANESTVPSAPAPTTAPFSASPTAVNVDFGEIVVRLVAKSAEPITQENIARQLPDEFRDGKQKLDEELDRLVAHGRLFRAAPLPKARTARFAVRDPLGGLEPRIEAMLTESKQPLTTEGLMRKLKAAGIDVQPVSEERLIEFLDGLVAKGALFVHPSRKPNARLYSVRKFTATPPVHETAVNHQKAFLLLQFLGPANRRLTRSAANNARVLTRSVKTALGFGRDFRMVNHLRDALARDGYLSRTKEKTDKKGTADVYEITERGLALLLSLDQHPSATLVVTGRAINQLVAEARSMGGDFRQTDGEAMGTVAEEFAHAR
jgi:DNA-binding PadR family transcriptional regulator